VTPLAIALGIAGGAWGVLADRIATRWPEHDEESPAGRPIGWRTVVVAVVGAGSLALLPGRFADPLVLLVFGAYLVALILLLATDLDQRLLPDVITLPAIPLAGVFVLTGLDPLVPPADLPMAVLAAIALPGGLFLLSIPFGAGAIGIGDLKLMASLGLLAGLGRAFSGLLGGAVLAGIVVSLLLVTRRVSLHSYVPFGPFLIVGALLAILRA
jgi:leader peptidase (prepilin peptidase)/N-methyltransferase